MGQRAQSLTGGEFPLALRVRGEPLLIGLRQAAAGVVQPRILSGRLDRRDREPLLADLRRILCLDHDLDAFYETVADDPPLERLTRRYRGLRVVLTPTPFQGLVHAILFQQITYTAAQTVENRLIVSFGEQLSYDDRPFPVFPTPERLAGQDVARLRALGIPPRKAQAILAVARRTVSGTLDLEALAAQGDADRAAVCLEAITGIGPWTAHHTIIRAMGMTDCLPTEDPGLRQAVAEQYGLAAVGAAQLRSLAGHWRPWRSCATYYLWNTFWA
jgi:DNA-3-methyladenine glycosylase II